MDIEELRKGFQGVSGRQAQRKKWALPAFALSTGTQINPFIAIDVAYGMDVLDELVSCFDSSVKEVLSADFLYARRDFDTIRDSVRNDPGAIEGICVRYFSHLRKMKLAPIARFDPLLMADMVWQQVATGAWDDGARPENYRYNWKIERSYREGGTYLFAPWLLRFNKSLPNPREIREIYKTIDRMRQIDHVVRLKDLPRISGHIIPRKNYSFMAFAFQNDCQLSLLCVGGHVAVAKISTIFPEYDIFAHHADHDRYATFSGLSSRSGLAAHSAHVEFHSGSMLRALEKSKSSLAHKLDVHEIVVKSRSLFQMQQRAGFVSATALLRLVDERLKETGSVVSLRDIGQRLGIEHLRLDPYSVEPGPVLVYAPSDRYLDPENVCFVLRDWVQDAQHRRGRIARDRVLTPLSPLSWRCTIAALAREALQSPSQRVLGFVCLSDLVKRYITPCDRHAVRWRDHRAVKDVSRIMESLGYIKAGSVFFDRKKWGGVLRGIRSDRMKKMAVQKALPERVLLSDRIDLARDLADLLCRELHLPLMENFSQSSAM